MSALRQSLQDYLALRRGLGFKRHARGQRLQDVVSFLEVPQAEFVTTALALAWAQQPQSADPAWWAQRVGFVRGFARYGSAIDPRTEVPPAALLPVHGKRAKPYLYTEEDINQLRQAALAQPQQ